MFTTVVAGSALAIVQTPFIRDGAKTTRLRPRHWLKQVALQCGLRELAERSYETHRFRLAGARPTRRSGFRGQCCGLRTWRLPGRMRRTSRCGRCASRRGCRAPPAGCRAAPCARLPLTAGFWPSARVKRRSASLPSPGSSMSLVTASARVAKRSPARRRPNVTRGMNAHPSGVPEGGAVGVNASDDLDPARRGVRQADQ